MPAGETPDLAAVLLRRARADAVALTKLRDDREVDDAIVGFHAQQAVEKAIKAVLAAREVDFPFVHDIARLIALLEGVGVKAPPDRDAAVELSPWAAELRYGEGLAEGLDRMRAAGHVADVLMWAEREVEQAHA